MTEIAWHAKSASEAAKKINTDPENGLSSEDYLKRFKKYGPNTIRRPKEFRWLKLVWKQLKSPLIFILIFAGAVALTLEEFTDAAVIFIAVFINAAIGVFQEGKADKAFEKLKSLVKETSIVVREGHEHEVDSSTLVPGDVLIIRAGDKIGADARLIEQKGLAVNEAALTGEWMPQTKNTETLKEETRITERTNMVWAGTFASDGWGRAIVVATAFETQLGIIAASLKETAQLTPFQKGVRHLARIIGGIVVAASAMIFLFGVLRGEGASDMFLTAVAISVAAVPEGLPVAATVILAVGMERILRKGGLIRNLNAAETLGSTSIILTDKTGTLTKAEMQISNIITPYEIFTRDAYKDEQKMHAAKSLALEIGVVSSEAFIENPEADLNDWIVRGRPTDQALLMAGVQAGLRPHEILKKFPRIDFWPFEAERRFAASLNSIGGDKSKTRLSIAGAPEKIISLCKFMDVGGTTETMTEEKMAEIKQAYKSATSGGSRVIAAAYCEDSWSELPTALSKEKDGSDNAGGNNTVPEFIFAGLMCFHDPLREDVKQSMFDAASAGLRPIMMTGDHISTAIAVANQADLSPGKKDYKAIEGEDLERIDDKTFKGLVDNFDIYARVLPHQKMNIVEAWQARGEVVAMTGDGVNDAPALKRADIGIALGSGTEVAKEASDLVLINNSFSVIVAAIEQGRVILDNMRKVVTFLLATGFTEIVLIGGALVGGLPLPILPAQILWANLVEEGFMNFAFAFEPKEKDVMKRNPKEHSSRRIVTHEMTWLIFGIGIITDIFLFGLFLILWNMNYPIEKIRTMMFAGLAIDAMFFVYPLKSLRHPLWQTNILSNPYLVASSIISTALLIAALTLPPLMNLLSLVHISIYEFAVVFALGALDLIAIEAAKYYFYRIGKFD